ncbi:AAA family ATPase [Saccharopolyspora hirsuta]|uniref:AAA family ATPase n=1 Tax=Saccharopolyspora hirsuta TaxID=1837 RepID=A0A5M7BPM9_SACHI|nr:AAA family ATPase [Saccharopolyspora hirsuta]KAA5830108.1 AAA family ATPase [Saccharopolyspora hirsuta]
MLTSRSTNHPHRATVPTLPQRAARHSPLDANAARAARSVACSSGHEELVDRVLDVCTRHSGTPLVLVTGPAGIGRSRVLEQVRARLTGQHTTTVSIRLSSGDRDLPSLVTRIATELGEPPARGESSAAVLRRLLATLTGRRRIVIFLDDAHWLTPRYLPTVRSVLGALAGSRTTLVCAVRTPTAPTDLAQLRARGLVHEERVRPLPVSGVEHLLSSLLDATPAPGLAAELRNACRGVPALVRAAVEGYLASGCLRVVDDHAHLVRCGAPQLPVTHPLFAALRDPVTWSAAKVLSVLHPLGDAAPSLIAAVTGRSEAEVLEALHELRAWGVITHRNGWRFRAPMLATLLAGCLGPYERRTSAQLAVTAIWDGTADPGGSYLADRIVDAGKLVDAERAATELLARGEAAPDHPHAARWRWAACELIADPAQRAAALHRHAVLCARHQRLALAGEAAEAALRDHPTSLQPDAAQELLVIALAGLASKANAVELRQFASTGWDSTPGSEASRVVARAAALCLLNRWSEARDELRTSHGQWRGTGSAALAHAIADAAVAVAGGTAPAAPQSLRPAVEAARTLLQALGLNGLGAPADEGTSTGRAVSAAVAGQWERALELARSAIAAASVHGDPPGQTEMFREVTTILTARGQLNRARAVLEDTRHRHLLLPHRLAAPESELELALGSQQRSRDVLASALTTAAENGVVVGTDELWLRLAELESRRGDQAAARRCANRVEQIAARLGSAEAHRSWLLAQVIVEHSAAAASEVLALAAEQDRPFEFAATVTTVAECGFGDQKLLRTAYEAYGELGALIPRARLRLLMRAHNVAVPGRNATVAENERLLATLVTEGLTNAQIATVLGTSEKSVEGRLTRFFQRTGYRSRAEIATATLRGCV